MSCGWPVVLQYLKELEEKIKSAEPGLMTKDPSRPRGPAVESTFEV